MKAISIRQPAAYVVGVLHGDGFITKPGRTGRHGYVGLRAKDRDFVEAFAEAVGSILGRELKPRRDERGYWLLRTYDTGGTFKRLRHHIVANQDERSAWLRGLFDSEGNAQCLKLSRGRRSYSRRVSVYSTSAATLDSASEMLRALGMATRRRLVKASAGHKGRRPVEELSLCSSRKSYARFVDVVGSSIGRKTATLARICASYTDDRRESCRRGQLLGAAEKHRRTMFGTLPAVVAEVRRLIDAGVKPTQRACRVIRGYDSIQRHVPQRQLIQMAEALCVP